MQGLHFRLTHAKPQELPAKAGMENPATSAAGKLIGARKEGLGDGWLVDGSNSRSCSCSFRDRHVPRLRPVCHWILCALTQIFNQDAKRVTRTQFAQKSDRAYPPHLLTVWVKSLHSKVQCSWLGTLLLRHKIELLCLLTPWAWGHLPYQLIWAITWTSA